jgi:hypothetical protein
LPQLRVAVEAKQGGGQPLGIEGIDEQSRLALAHELGKTPDSSGHHRPAHRLGFEDGEGLVLEPFARLHDADAPGEELLDPFAGDPPQGFDLWVGSQEREEGPVSHDLEPHARGKEAECRCEGPDSLLLDDATREEERAVFGHGE